MTARATFERLSNSINFKFTAHDLRRTLATVASEQGVDLDAVGRVLNHKKQGVTAGYIQTTQKRLKDTLEMVAAAFFEEPVLGDVYGD
jgi:integrase